MAQRSNRKRVTEQYLYGRNCVHKVFEKRPDQILKINLVRERLTEFSDLLKYCAGSEHHEGISMVCARPSPHKLEDYLAETACLAGHQTILILDRVANPHNLGAIIRSAAHFNISALVVQKDVAPVWSGATARVAEGGLEEVSIITVDAILPAVKTLEGQKYKIFGGVASAKKSLYQLKFPSKCVLLLGAENDGISKPLLHHPTLIQFNIPGSGHVESLNVSVAAGVVMAERYRQTNSVD